jgi:hypothetical protein
MNDEKQANSDNLPDSHEHHIKMSQARHRALVLMIMVLTVALAGVGSALAYQYAHKQISQCTGDGMICYEIQTSASGEKKATVKNLDPNKKYQIVIKKKTDANKYVDIAVTDVNMKSKTSVPVKPDVPAPIPGTQPSLSHCLDTDNGHNYYVKGTVKWFVQNFEKDDYCDTGTGELMEHFCFLDASGNVMYEDFGYMCPYGCLDGACKQPDPGVAMKAYGERCGGTPECTAGFECKDSGRYPGNQNLNLSYVERYCCRSTECASVIPDGAGSTDAQPHCVATGGTDSYDGPGVSMTKICQDGVYSE